MPESDDAPGGERPRVRPELCLVRPVLSSAREVLEALASLALTHGFVRPSFGPALIAREEAYPTGLPTPVPVAIPHTDAEHVLRPALAAALLDPPVAFREMGGADREVPVRLVVALMVTDPASQVGVLSVLIGALRAPELADVLAVVDDPRSLADAVQSLITGGE